MITSRYQLRALPWVGFVNKSSYGKVQMWEAVGDAPLPCP